ncbi:MAG: hypothetical protein IGR76_05445 [Synechococcales cyanobacterium T60_A2020_003]|nr:hypothetical protein [Synechococcales cyanobacterium T60_A2020_003]
MLKQCLSGFYSKFFEKLPQKILRVPTVQSARAVESLTGEGLGDRPSSDQF